ncbi:beta strand repeat-containing protein, partial [Arenimonas sp. MALMAid1274]|uniref:beta strand repeat-containing protein n=1 Tax=Arenimonas sp. MALMAid1274 TaxID=3411630 RepID=UPI003B9F9E83
MNADGSVDVAPNTPAGTYTVDYEICEVLNPANCDTATVTVTVEAATIDAVNDSAGPINGATGGTNVVNVLANDQLNGAPLNPAAITLVPVTNGPLTVNADGSVDVAPNTPAGTYTVDYEICEVLNPANCDTATVTITVEEGVIDAVNDTAGPVNGFIANTNVVNVLGNDLLNGALLNPADITLAPVTNGPLTVNADGSVDVAAGTAAGTYTVNYEICEVLNPANCDTATVTVTVEAAVLDAVNDTAGPVNGATGSTNVVNVLANDQLNGAPLNPAAIPLVPVTNGPLTVNADGSVDVAPNTPAGTYTVDYEICEVLNPANCDTATVTVTVEEGVIDAVNDTAGPVNGFVANANVVNVLGNDLLNAAAVNAADITLVPVTNGPLTVNADGSVDVAANTPAGTYTVDYEICELLNPANCDTATVTVIVEAAIIDAVNDSAGPINGATGGTNVVNVLANDQLNGAPVNPAAITLVPVTNGPLTVNADGSVDVAAGTTAGTYTVDYEICEVLNPANCDTATVTVTVEAATIDAVNDSAGPVNGFIANTNVVNVLGNDLLNGAAVNPADITLVPVTTGPLTVNGDGSVDVAAGTAAGTYTVDYEICEVLNPTNCDTATVTVTVEAATIDAVNDSAGPVNGFVANTNVVNVLGNDLLNGAAVNPADITLVPVTNGPLTVNADGSVDVAANTPAGTYTIDYTICEVLNPANCDTATVTVTVEAATIDAVNDSAGPVNGFVANVNVVNVFSNDTLNGTAVVPANVSLAPVTNGPLTVNADGSVDVAAGTAAGTYTVDYTICEVLNPANCDTATVTVIVEAATIDAVNDSAGPVNGFVANVNVVNVFGNDTLNGAAVVPANVTLAPVTNGPLTVNADGSVDVAAGTAAGTYTVDYEICEVLNPANCDTATVTVTVEAATIDAVNDSAGPINGATGGTNVVNVLANDQLNGAPVNPAAINLVPVTNGPLTVNADGSVDVAPN